MRLALVHEQARTNAAAQQHKKHLAFNSALRRHNVWNSHDDEIGAPFAVGGSGACGVNTSVVASFAVMVALTVSASHGGHFFVFGSGLAHGGQDVTLNESEPHAHIEPCVELAFLL
jgi:hypothetical protein